MNCISIPRIARDLATLVSISYASGSHFVRPTVFRIFVFNHMPEEIARGIAIYCSFVVLFAFDMSNVLESDSANTAANKLYLDWVSHMHSCARYMKLYDYWDFHPRRDEIEVVASLVSEAMLYHEQAADTKRKTHDRACILYSSEIDG